MKINPDFASPCGLYCGVCAIHIAHRDNNQKFKERLVNLYKGGVLGKVEGESSAFPGHYVAECRHPSLTAIIGFVPD